jgi:hypothetical protein
MGVVENSSLGSLKDVVFQGSLWTFFCLNSKVSIEKEVVEFPKLLSCSKDFYSSNDFCRHYFDLKDSEH